MSNAKTSSHSHVQNKQTPTAPIGIISLQAHAAVLRRKTEVRRMLEDLRFAAQAATHPYHDKA